MFKLRKENIYTLRNIIGYWLHEDLDFFDNAHRWNLKLGAYIPVFIGSSIISIPFMSNQRVKDVLDLVSTRYGDEVVFSCTPDSLDKEARNLLDKIVQITNNTYERYTTLLDLYDQQKEKLLDAVRNISSSENEHVNKFKDTPQADIDPESDAYNTSVTYNKTEGTITVADDRATPMDRLNEVQEKYRNVMLDWSNEYDALFVDIKNYI